LTVWFANFAEALAEGRGKAKAASLRRTKTESLKMNRLLSSVWWISRGVGMCLRRVLALDGDESGAGGGH
jgi:hypothetical protein